MPIRLLLMILAVAMVGCQAPEEGRSRIPPRDLRINLGGEPETMDPSLNTSLIGSRILKGVLEGVILLDENSEAQPAGALRWESNDDYTLWTFHLRPEAQWHNGDPVTAHDYVYGVERILTPSLAAEYAKVPLSIIKGAREFMSEGGLDTGQTLEGVRAEHDHTLIYELQYPAPFFPTVLDLTCWYPLHRATIEEHGAAWSTSPRTFMGNGPFRMAVYRSRDRAEIVRAETYWDRESIYWDKVLFYFIESLATEMQAFRTGDLDITNKVSLAEVDYWRERPEWSIAESFGTYFLGFNTQRAPFDDARVRRAFSIAIDRVLITDRVLRRGEVPGQGLIPEMLESARGGTWREHAGDLIGSVDVETARELIAEAGYGPGGRSFPAMEYVYDEAEDHKIIAEQIQNMWREAFGLDIRLQNVDWGTRLQRGRQGEFEVVRMGWYGDYLDAMTFMELFQKDSEFNNPRMDNPRYDELIEMARHEPDPVRREDLMMEAEKLLVVEEAAIAPLFTYALPMLIRADVKGIVRNATGDLHYQRARRDGGSEP